MNLPGIKRILKSKEDLESRFIIGLDLGDSASSICYFDPVRRSPEIIDLSGGYGRASVPTVLQYIKENKEWIFGEYAVLNDGMTDGEMFRGMVKRLGGWDYLDVGGRPEPLSYVLSVFLKELLANCKSINPKAEIAGIVVSVPDYMPSEAGAELMRAFSQIGMDKKIIALAPHRECILAHHYLNRPAERENILILDYGSRELRAGIYEIEPHSTGLKARILSYLFDESLGTGLLDKKITESFAKIYMDKMAGEPGMAEPDMEQMSTFSYQHKDSIFQKHLPQKGMRLYYNFAYPPFYHIFTREDQERIIKPFKEGFWLFIERLFKNNKRGQKRAIDFSDITTVLCTGGGFEMLWAREATEELLPDANIFTYKNSKSVNALGASVLAAKSLGVDGIKTVSIQDRLQVRNDIGIVIASGASEKFYPLIERGSFWWQNKKQVKLLLKDETKGMAELGIYKRDIDGIMTFIGDIKLTNLPRRPKGATQLDLQLEYIDTETLKAGVKDKGFGNFFPESGDYAEELFKV